MNKTFLVLSLFVALLLMGTVSLTAQSTSPPAGAGVQPPKVGDTAPDFTLPSGPKLAPMKLSDMRGKKKVLLAFYVFDFTGG
ncbi:MAG: redoxin domain-containing protein [Acidobacteriia bacterium]|nr:redoxin domain-containing protein [Terriglobia bacterium]